MPHLFMDAFPLISPSRLCLGVRTSFVQRVADVFPDVPRIFGFRGRIALGARVPLANFASDCPRTTGSFGLPSNLGFLGLPSDPGFLRIALEPWFPRITLGPRVP